MFDPDRTKLSLPFIKKQATKTSEHEQKLRDYLSAYGESNIHVLAECVGLSAARTRAILAEMTDVFAEGERNKRTYRL